MATLTTILLVYLATGQLAVSLGIGAVDVVVKLGLYYGHERVWARIGWGRVTPTVGAGGVHRAGE